MGQNIIKIYKYVLLYRASVVEYYLVEDKT